MTDIDPIDESGGAAGDAGRSAMEELRAANDRLRRLLEQRDAPTELRHRLRGTFALLRAIIRRSAPGRTNVESYAAQLEDRLDSLARVHGTIDREGSADLSSLIADELFSYQAQEGRKVHMAGPAVRLTPRASQSLGLAIHELAVNAVEHGALPTSLGRIDVAWSVAEGGADPALVLEWKETGSSDLAQPEHEGFGTDVLTRMLAHELGARTTLAFERDGMRFSMRLPATHLVDRT